MYKMMLFVIAALALLSSVAAKPQVLVDYAGYYAAPVSYAYSPLAYTYPYAYAYSYPYYI